MPPGDPLRLAFVGQRTYFEPCALQDPVDGVEPAFFDLRPSEAGEVLHAQLAAFAPDAVIVFRPELLPDGWRPPGLDAVLIGWLTEPLPRGPGAHADLLTRLSVLRAADLGGFDRIV